MIKITSLSGLSRWHISLVTPNIIHFYYKMQYLWDQSIQKILKFMLFSTLLVSIQQRPFLPIFRSSHPEPNQFLFYQKTCAVSEHPTKDYLEFEKHRWCSAVTLYSNFNQVFLGFCNPTDMKFDNTDN